MSAVIVSIINLKGGVGKSTLAMILGEFLAFRYAKRVLLIDMDAQGNLSYCMIPGAQVEEQERGGRTIYHLLKMALEGENTDIAQFITQPPLIVSNIARSAARKPPGVLEMVVSTPTVAQLDEDLLTLWENNKPMPTQIRYSLLEALEPARERYDYVIIDCPPGLSIFSSTALVASNYFVSPVIPEPLSLQGVSLVRERANQLRELRDISVQYKGIILNIVKHYRQTHQRTANGLYGAGLPRYNPFNYWLPDSEELRKLGEFNPDLEGQWAGGMDTKFGSLYEKYGLSYRLTNPPGGELSRRSEEGAKYRLEDRIVRLVEEFMERCPQKSLAQVV